MEKGNERKKSEKEESKVKVWFKSRTHTQHNKLVPLARVLFSAKVENILKE